MTSLAKIRNDFEESNKSTIKRDKDLKTCSEMTETDTTAKTDSFLSGFAASPQNPGIPPHFRYDSNRARERKENGEVRLPWLQHAGWFLLAFFALLVVGFPKHFAFACS